MDTKNKTIWNGTKLLGLHSEKVLSYEQLERATQIVKRERQKYTTREEQDKMVDKKCLELVTALRECKTEKEKNDILNGGDIDDYRKR